MKTLVIELLIAILIYNYSIAQAPNTLWIKTFGDNLNDYAYLVQETVDTGYVIMGTKGVAGAYDEDIWLIKTDSSGDTLWTKTFGGDSLDRALGGQQTADGGYIIVGGTNSYGAGHLDVWLIKTNSYGDTLWTKTFGGSEEDQGLSVQQTTDGGYIITGYTYSFGLGYQDVWLIKTDSSGNAIWTKTFGESNAYDWGQSVQQTNDGGYIVTGITGFSGINWPDAWLIKTDNFGNILWTKTYGTENGDERGNSVRQALDGGYIIIGRKGWFMGGGNSDVWLLKTDSSGDTLWTKLFGGVNEDRGKSVQQTVDGGYILVGVTFSFGSGSWDIWLIRTDAFGDTIWTKTFGGNYIDIGESIQQTEDGGYIITGYANSTSAFTDICLIKTTPDVSNIDSSTDLVISDFSLNHNYPNPFNPSTKISWQARVGSWQTLKVYDVLGNEVTTLVDEYKPVGNYEAEWNAADLSSGVYFYQLKTENFIQTKKMILMK